jgi:hypothetical protein
MHPMKYKFTLYDVLAVLLFLAGITAIPAAVNFMMDPSGHRSGATMNVLDSTPFIDFYFPGLFILVFITVANIASAVVTMVKLEVSGFLGIVSGIIMILWIIVQIYWCGFNYLQPFSILLALSEIVAGSVIMLRVLKGITPRKIL